MDKAIEILLLVIFSGELTDLRSFVLVCIITRSGFFSKSGLTCSMGLVRNGGKVKHELQVTSSNPQVTGSNPRATSSNPRIRTLKARVRRLKARV